MDFLQLVFLQNTVRAWLFALAIFLVLFLVLLTVRSFLYRRLQRLFANRESGLDAFILSLVRGTRVSFLLILSLYFASLALVLPPSVVPILGLLAKGGLLIQIGLWLNTLINYLIARRVRSQLLEDAGNAGTISTLGLFLRGVAWIIVVIMILNNIPGIRVDTLIASLGITGIAVGLAVQNILGDLFASLSIALDQPFVIGDSITVGDFTGTVEHIGLKSTRVRALSGEQLVFGNNDLLSSRIRNFKRMNRRRVVFNIRVTYQTPYEALKRIPEIVQEVVQQQEKVTFDRAHFSGYGEYALIFEVVFLVEESDYRLYMDVQQSIYLEIFRRFEEEGIAFAYPTQTVYQNPTFPENGSKEYNPQKSAG